jgi:hypothetical protein
MDIRDIGLVAADDRCENVNLKQNENKVKVAQKAAHLMTQSAGALKFFLPTL